MLRPFSGQISSYWPVGCRIVPVLDCRPTLSRSLAISLLATIARVALLVIGMGLALAFTSGAAFAQSADLSVTISNPTVIAGNNVTYTISVQNSGTDLATLMSLNDPLPAGTSFVSMTQNSGPSLSCTTPAVGGGGTVTCSTATLPVGAAATFELVLAVGANVAGGTTISNTATVSSATPDPVGVNNAATASTMVTTSADLSVTMSDSPDPVNPGSNITYAITAHNAGPSDAATVLLGDTLPAGTTFVSLSQAGGPSFSCATPPVGAAGAINCSIASMPVGDAAFTLVVAVDASVPGATSISNTATASSATPDPVVGNGSGTASTAVGAADISVTVADSPDPVTAGQNLTYTITANNAGPSNAATVSLNDTLPAGTSFASLSAPGGWSCTTPAVAASGTISCSSPSLAVGNAVFTLTVAVDPGTLAGTTISNTATASSLTSDPVPGNESGTASTTVAASADLGVAIAGVPSAANAGGNVTFTITASNAGPSNAAAVVVSAPLPAGMTFVSLSSPGGWSCATPPMGAAGTVTCSNPSFAVASQTFTLIATIDPGTAPAASFSNTVAVSATTPDGNTSNNNAAAATTTVQTTSTTSLNSNHNPSANGQSVTFTATVAAFAGGGTPTGTVTFSIDGVPQPPAPISANVATFTTSSLSVGNHAISAAYAGDANFVGSTSSTLTQAVQDLGTIIIREVTNGSDGSFGFSSPAPALNFTISTSNGSGQSPNLGVPFGSYSITAADMTGSGFALTAIACSDTDSSGSVSSRTASIVLAAGETVICTFTSVDSRTKTTGMIEDFFNTRANLILSNQPDVQRRIDRLNGAPGDAGNPASALMGLMPILSGSPLTMSASLGAIEAAAGNKQPSRLDVWMDGTFGLFDKSGPNGAFGLGAIGGDYLVNADLLIGGMLQVDSVAQSSVLDPGTISGTGWLAGPYMTARLTDNLYLDLLAAAGTSSNTISPFGTYTDRFSATRFLLSGALQGQWTQGAWTLSPVARFSYFQESSEGYTDSLGVAIPAVTAGLGQVAIGPSISYRFVTDGEIVVDTGLKLEGILDVSTRANLTEFQDAHATIASDIGLSLPGGAHLGFSVAYDGIGGASLQAVSGTVKLSGALN
jgi:uncharacterized repeat protein (TIGR01451 family)